MSLAISFAIQVRGTTFWGVWGSESLQQILVGRNTFQVPSAVEGGVVHIRIYSFGMYYGPEFSAARLICGLINSSGPTSLLRMFHRKLNDRSRDECLSTEWVHESHPFSRSSGELPERLQRCSASHAERPLGLRGPEKQRHPPQCLTA